MNPHVLFAVSTFMALLVGWGLAAWVLATNTVTSKLNGIQTYRDYLKANLAIVCYRFALLAFGMMLYAEFRLDICIALGTAIPGLGWLKTHQIPVNPATAGILGLFGDPAISTLFGFLSRWIPALRKEVPIEAATKP